jgi:peptidoglycan/xylan/chitin deacetylase (PgdA/CDA1 family)
LIDLTNLSGLRVLCFHSISDLSGTGLARFGIPKVEFRETIDRLVDSGVEFIDPQEVLGGKKRLRNGVRLNALITFDDCYEDIVDAFDVLAVRNIRAMIFPVSSLIGSYNRWQRQPDVPRLPLLGIDGLRSLVEQGWVIGSHTHTHRNLATIKHRWNLTALADRRIRYEIDKSVRTLNQLGLRCAAVFAYPYGAHNARVCSLVAQTSIDLAFTTKPGIVTEKTDPLAIPRIEINRGELGDRLVGKVLRTFDDSGDRFSS